MAGGEHSGERRRAALNADRIVELRDQGLTFREIAAEVGVSFQRCWQIYQKALRDRPVIAEHVAKRAERAAEQLRRIDMEREAVVEVLANRHVMVSNGVIVKEDGTPILDDGPILAAVDRLVKLDDQEAKLLGLYAKTEVEHSGGVRHELVGVDPREIV